MRQITSPLKDCVEMMAITLEFYALMILPPIATSWHTTFCQLDETNWTARLSLNRDTEASEARPTVTLKPLELTVRPHETGAPDYHSLL